MNKTLLVLIPKIQNPERVNQFRPISLCSVAYKILTITIVNRLRPFMKKLISQNLSSFIPGRDIAGNIIVAQEVIHSLKGFRSRKKGMVLKIDLVKAYDRISWDFLRDTLLLAGFPKELITVIMGCVFSASFQVLWNGNMTEGFEASRGVRQGDPLSPYLFVLCMERLGYLIEDAIDSLLYLSKRGPALSPFIFC